jgi:signal transduction histidine kinase
MTNNYRIKKLSTKLATIIMIISFSGIATLSYISYYQAREIFLDNSKKSLQNNLNKYTSYINDSIKALKYNITMLAFNSSIHGLLRAYNDKYKYDEKTNKTFDQFSKEVKSLFSLMIRQNPSYFQIRVLDYDSAKELIKIEKRGGRIVSIPTEKLQDKSSSEYIQAIKNKRRKSQIYLSEINLNKEYHTIELPLKPTIRILEPISLKNGKKGIIIINANIKKLFGFQDILHDDKQNTYIVNSKGYYILNTKEPFKEFGEELGGDYKIYDSFYYIKSFLDSSKRNSIFIEKHTLLIAGKKINLSQKNQITVIKTSEGTLFDEKSNQYILKLILSIIIIVFIITLATLITVKKFTSPISRLIEVAKKLAKTKGEENIDIKIESNDEIGELAKSLKIMLGTILESKQELNEFANKLELEVKEKTKELQLLNTDLQHKVDKQVDEARKKEEILVQQSKMAAMGEMIGAIAHQWRQPLNSLGLNIQLLVDMAEDKDCEVEKIEKFVEKNMQTIEFMSKTIDNFRNFFRKDKKKALFDVKDAVNETVFIQKDRLTNHNIALNLYLISCEVYGYKNEFMQVILNIISNANDAIMEKRKEIPDFEGIIDIENEIVDDEVIISIKNNGNHIPQESFDRILEPYFTTKEEGQGTGIGLYMSKQIIENMGGRIEYENVDGLESGVVFKIILRIADENS